MTVAETSLRAFENNQATFNKDRDRVFAVIRKKGPITGADVAREMQKPYHAISGRITELLKQNRIQVSGRTQNQFGNTVRQYEVKK